MKKSIRILSTVLVFVLVLSCMVFTGLTASAAYVTDGYGFYPAGDLNDDGNINILDLVKAHLYEGSTSDSSYWSVTADLDGTGDIGAYDYALIRAMILGTDNSQWTE